MTSKENSIKIKRTIQAPASDVYAAFTHATALTEWLCNVAEADASEGGRLYLWWNSGYYASGEFTSLVPGEHIAFSWHGRNEPGITRVKIDIKPRKEGSTRISLTHSQLGSGKPWKQTLREYQRGWKNSLENLQSILETGMDLRFINRPIFGLSGALSVDADKAASLGFSAKPGLFIEGVMDGKGAATAGLQNGDLLVRLGGKKIKGFDTLVAALQRYQAGDTIKVVFYRQNEKITGKAQLTARPLPEVPFSAEALADAVEKNNHILALELGQSLQTASEEAASYCPSPGEWNVKENLAHLIAGERDLQAWIASLIEGQESSTIYHTNHPARLNAMISAFSTTKNLVTEYKRSQAETVALLRTLPVELASRKGAFWRLGYTVLTLPDHIREHNQQIQTLLEAANQTIAEQSVEKLPTETGEEG